MKCGNCGDLMIDVPSGMTCSRGCGRIERRVDAVDVFPPGTTVRLTQSLDGVVVAVMLRGTSHLQYEVAYWDNGTRSTVWVDDFEINSRAEVIEPVRIGFLVPGDSHDDQAATATAKQKQKRRAAATTKGTRNKPARGSTTAT